MKKILCFVLAMFMISACTQAEPVVNEDPLVQSEDVKIITKILEDKNLDNFELLGQHTVEIDGIEKEICISLYTSAMRDKKGELMWDDTQEWVLRAETAFGHYVLYDERIHGRAYMNVYNEYNDNSEQTVISLNVFGNAFNEIREYRFSEDGFVETVSYSTDETAKQGISELYSSIPQYE